MPHAITAEDLYQDLKQLPSIERHRFFEILATKAFGEEDLSHEQLFGHLEEESFTAQEAAEYLEVSMSTFRRYVASEKLVPATTLGRNQMFGVPELKVFKQALKATKG